MAACRATATSCVVLQERIAEETRLIHTEPLQSHKHTVEYSYLLNTQPAQNPSHNQYSSKLQMSQPDIQACTSSPYFESAASASLALSAGSHSWPLAAALLGHLRSKQHTAKQCQPGYGARRHSRQTCFEGLRPVTLTGAQHHLAAPQSPADL